MARSALTTASLDELVEHAPNTVGQRLRDARLIRGWTLDQLSERSGVSRRMIVNVEAGSTNPSLATLLRLSAAMGIALASLIAEPMDARNSATTRSQDRTPLWTGPKGGSGTLLASASQGSTVELWEWLLEPGESHTSEAHLPGTHELLHVLEGQLDLTVDKDSRRLRTGDATNFAADVAHAYTCAGRKHTKFTIAVLDPTTKAIP